MEIDKRKPRKHNLFVKNSNMTAGLGYDVRSSTYIFPLFRGIILDLHKIRFQQSFHTLDVQRVHGTHSHADPVISATRRLGIGVR